MSKGNTRKTYSYGEAMAKAMYAERARKARAAVERESKRASSEQRNDSAPRPPALNLHPDLSKFDAMPNITWESIDSIADHTAQMCDDSNFVILRMPTGTGKTSSALLTLSKLAAKQSEAMQFIIVAPRAVVDGGGWQKTLNAWNNSHPDAQLKPLMIETHDRFANILKHGETLKQTVNLLGKHGVVILDEVHAYKSPTSKRSKTLQRLRSFRKLGLTATPFTNDAIHDGISYLVTAGMYTSKSNFYNVSGLRDLLDPFGRPRVYRKTDRGSEVNTRVWPYYTKMQAELSNIIYSPDIDMTSIDMPELLQTTLQVEYDTELVDKLNSIHDAYRKGAFESALDLVLSLSATIGSSQARLNLLTDVIQEDWVKQPLVFYWNNSVKDALLKHLGSLGMKPQILSGDSPASELDFDDPRPILVQYQAGSEGVEFKNSNVSVFYQNQSSASKLTQARGRNVRRGSTHRVHQYQLVSPVMFDIELFERLEERMDLSSKMLEEIAVRSMESLNK